MADNLSCESITIANLVRDIQNKRSIMTLVWNEPDMRVGSKMVTGSVKWFGTENVCGVSQPDPDAEAIRQLLGK